ncbi:hypothetical protein CLOM_g9751 [Closterium sp. NIES-68]|nr:hypothetical protein CLOM_g9751 [Closterium sp. NIES-68]GJP76745.1 hypothetical protein CLOP_g7209 [Closterium sp. NIES-67]
MAFAVSSIPSAQATVVTTAISSSSHKSASPDTVSFTSSFLRSPKPILAVRSRKPCVARKACSVRAMVASTDAVSFSAKEMERVAAKEALLLAVKDAGGAEALSTGKGNAAGKIEVSEKLLQLERLNPTPRPTTSPLLEGRWDIVWTATRNPGVIATRVLLKRFPTQVASLESLQVQILEGATKVTAGLKFLSAAETTVTVTTRLAVEGPVRIKEEYAEAVLATPVVADGSIPSALKGVVDQLASASQSLPAAVKDAFSSGLKLPLNGRYQRELIISYLDDEILVARDQAGLADVLVRATSTTTTIPSGDESEIDEPTP